MKNIICGVYEILNTLNNKRYVGSSNNISIRWKRHLIHLKKEKHANYHLQKDWVEYHAESFNFKIIEECDENDLVCREQYWINFYKTMNRDFGYNIEPAHRTFMTNETKKKISKSHMGKIISEKTKQKMKDNHADFSGEKHPKYGTHLSEETKEKIRKAHIGKKLSEEHKNKISKNGKNKKRKFISPSGEEFIVIGNFISFCKLHQLRHDDMRDVFMKRIPEYKGWKGEYID